MLSNWTGLLSLVKREILRFFVVVSQTIIPPLISSALFIFVFGFSIGKNLRVDIHGYGYLEFLIPGLVMMHLIESAYTNTSSSLFIARWHNHIQEILLSPLSYFEMVLGLLAGGMARGLLTAFGVYGISLCFVRLMPHNFWVVLYFMLTVSVIFSCIGILVALWADNFENLSVWSTFVITPLIYFGGVFHSITMVPELLQTITRLNPIFYLISGFRYGMLGIRDASVAGCLAVAGVLAVVSFLVVENLFRRGYKLRV